jgi:hypothetical protein
MQSISSAAQNSKSFKLNSIKIDSSISLYEDFQLVDKLPEKSIPESYLPKRPDRAYYVSTGAYSYLDQDIKHLILTTDSTGNVLALNIVIAFSNSVLDKLISEYGPWTVATSIGQNINEPSGSAKLGIYVWKYLDNTLINVIVNRYENAYLEDNVVVTYSRKK